MLQTKTTHRLRHATIDVLWSAGEWIKVEYKRWSEIIYERHKTEEFV